MADLMNLGEVVLTAAPTIRHIPDGCKLISDIVEFGNFIADAASFLMKDEGPVPSLLAIERFAQRGKKPLSHRHLETVAHHLNLVLPGWDGFCFIATGTRWIDEQGKERFSFLGQDSTGRWVISQLRADSEFGPQDRILAIK